MTDSYALLRYSLIFFILLVLSSSEKWIRFTILRTRPSLALKFFEIIGRILIGKDSSYFKGILAMSFYCSNYLNKALARKYS